MRHCLTLSRKDHHVSISRFGRARRSVPVDLGYPRRQGLEQRASSATTPGEYIAALLGKTFARAILSTNPLARRPGGSSITSPAQAVDLPSHPSNFPVVPVLVRMAAYTKGGFVIPATWSPEIDDPPAADRQPGPTPLRDVSHAGWWGAAWWTRAVSSIWSAIGTGKSEVARACGAWPGYRHRSLTAHFTWR